MRKITSATLRERIRKLKMKRLSEVDGDNNSRLALPNEVQARSTQESRTPVQPIGSPYVLPVAVGTKRAYYTVSRPSQPDVTDQYYERAKTAFSSRRDTAIESDITSLKSSFRERTLMEKMSLTSKKFFNETTLHGLKFLIEGERPLIERFFWLVAVVLSWTVGGFFINELLFRWSDNPVVLSFDSAPVPIWEVPFPGLTICNMNKIRHSRVLANELKLEQNLTSKHLIDERILADEICGYNEAANRFDIHTDLNLSGKKLHYYLKDLGHTCEDMLIKCKFEGIDRNCSDIFEATLTDLGECCSFNIMPEAIMFKNDEIGVPRDFEEERRWNDWDMQAGYHRKKTKLLTEEDALHKADYIDPKTEEMPRRAAAPGINMGLTVTLDVERDEYFCSETNSVGFKGLLHLPYMVPELIEYGFAVHPGSEGYFQVSPTVVTADPGIEDYNYRDAFLEQIRQCYLESERHLHYFKHYSFLNCFMECVSNYTFHHCGCVAFYMPRHQEYMPVCSPDKKHCVKESIFVVEETAFEVTFEHENTTISQCQCLPACTDIGYSHESSFSSVSKADLLGFDEKKLEKHPEYATDEYARENIAIVHIFFKNLHFMNHKRGSLYGTLDLFSNIGGLLGLCMGLSALSVVEIFYFFLIRLGFNVGCGYKEEKD